MLKTVLLATLLFAVALLAACDAASPTPAGADASKVSRDPGVHVSGSMQTGGSSTVR